MKNSKESSRPCPSCNTKLPRGNWRKYMSRCNECFTLICNSCNYASKCVECFNKSSASVESANYFIEKYGTVSGVVR